MRAAILISSSDRAKRLAAAAGAGEQQPEHRRQPAAGAPRRRRREPMPRCAPRCSSRSTRCAAGSPGASGSASIFTGISLGSVLLLVALGLAITYGLMGVINMAHGELMMIGAYTTYVVQNLFRAYAAGRVRRLRAGGDPGRVPGRGAGRRGARARRHPLPLRPAARDAARHLGHQPGPAAGGALDLRRAERAGREPDLALRRRRR